MRDGLCNHCANTGAVPSPPPAGALWACPPSPSRGTCRLRQDKAALLGARLPLSPSRPHPPQAGFHDSPRTRCERSRGRAGRSRGRPRRAAPSASIRSNAATSRGKPMPTQSSTQLIVTESISSRVDGIIFREMIAETVRAASMTSSYSARRVFLVRGFGISFKAIFEKIPMVPSDPIKNFVRLYPATSLRHLVP